MSMGFTTFQIPQNYEDALGRHGQWVRWLQGIPCPCLSANTMQPDPACSLCSGRGKMYRSPSNFRFLNERARHDNLGRVYTSHVPVVVGSATVTRKGSLLSLGTSPMDGSYVQLAAPWPKAWEELYINYSWSPEVSVTNENSQVYGTNILRTLATSYIEKGKSFEGSLKSVSRVRNVTRSKTYTVASAVKEYVYLTAMDSWVSGDVLEVDYIYILPFNFLLNGVTSKMRYEQSYIVEEADAVLITPYWARVAPDDLITAMAMEQIGSVVIDPKVRPGNDVVATYYDLSVLMRVISETGTEYTVGPGGQVDIYGRNELKWTITKPTARYTAQFTYHPTFTALTNKPTLRNAENKSFVNRVSVKQIDHVHEKVVY